MDFRSIAAISDTHSGCQFALCPGPVKLDGGGIYYPSVIQQKLWSWWEEYWKEWIPRVTKKEPFAVVHNGDAVDGRHHGSTSQISHNLADQEEIAYQLLAPVVDRCKGNYYHIRGTEAHVGQSAECEERLARRLGAIPDESGNYARYELWATVNGDKGPLCHFAHHIGTTGRTHYETSAVMAELAELFTESGRWNNRPPDVVVRAHRHRAIEVRTPTHSGLGISMTLPAWQLKTPFAYKIPGGRTSLPQIGGSIIRHGDEDFVYTRHFVKALSRQEAV